MDHAALVNEDRRVAGRRIVHALEESGLPVFAAFWHWDPDGQEDRLAIASPVVKEQGPNAVYDRIEAIYGAHPDVPRLPFSQIEPLRTDDPQLGALHGLNYAARPGTEAGASVLGVAPTLYDVWIYVHPREHSEMIPQRRG